MTCRDRDGVVEETQPRRRSDGTLVTEPILTKVEDIVDEFKHDKLPQLKGAGHTCVRLSACAYMHEEYSNVKNKLFITATHRTK